MGAVLQITRALKPTTCANCGIEFAAPETFLDARRSDAKGFYCPNGHVLSWKETEADRLKKQLESEKRAREFTESQLRTAREQRDAAERQAVALRGVVTKAKKRVANGVCPCCNRTFQQIARHMKAKHPDYQHHREPGHMEDVGG